MLANTSIQTRCHSFSSLCSLSLFFLLFTSNKIGSIWPNCKTGCLVFLLGPVPMVPRPEENDTLLSNNLSCDSLFVWQIHLKTIWIRQLTNCRLTIHRMTIHWLTIRILTIRLIGWINTLSYKICKFCFNLTYIISV